MRQGIVYELYDKLHPWNFYIGSTWNMKARMREHERQFRIGNICFLFSYMRTNHLSPEMFELVILEDKEFPNLHTRKVEEQRWIDLENPNLNDIRADGVRTDDAYKQHCKDLKVLSDKRYRETHPDSDKEHGKKWYAEHKIEELVKQKQNYEEHKEEILTKQHAYWNEKKDGINAKRNIKNKCPCGGKYTSGNKAVHRKGKEHIKWFSEHIDIPDPTQPKRKSFKLEKEAYLKNKK